MSNPARLTEQEKADFVAYLDGELDAEASHALEAKLARDPDARAEVEQLRHTWELLDYLPKPEPSPNFTHRTLERLGPIPTGTQPKPPGGTVLRWAFVGGWAASVALALVGGYLSLTLFLARTPAKPEPTEQDLVRDLRLIENKRLYEVADDLDFLRELDHPDLFGEETIGS